MTIFSLKKMILMHFFCVDFVWFWFCLVERVFFSILSGSDGPVVRVVRGRGAQWPGVWRVHRRLRSVSREIQAGDWLCPENGEEFHARNGDCHRGGISFNASCLLQWTLLPRVTGFCFDSVFQLSSNKKENDLEQRGVFLAFFQWVPCSFSDWKVSLESFNVFNLNQFFRNAFFSSKICLFRLRHLLLVFNYFFLSMFRVFDILQE